jgi:glutamyl-tRNA reductase
MMLRMVGCNHRQAAVELRERLAFTPEQVTSALAEFRRRYPDTEAVLLSTCNRVELYTMGSDAANHPNDPAIDFLADWHQLPVDQLSKQLARQSGNSAIEHLFHVAASLDSMVVGEPQIAAQVKDAYDLSVQSGAAGPITHLTFQAASRVAKRIARETGVHQRRVSIPSVAICEVAAEFYESLVGKKVVVIGAGEMAEEALRYLRDRQASEVSIINRSFDRAARLAASFAVSPVPWERLDHELLNADIVVSTTSAQEPIVTVDHYAPLHEQRYQRPILVLDLAVPRDFDPAIGQLDGVYLYSVDDLEAACQRNRKEREKEYPKARRIIDEELQRLLGDMQHRGTGPVIQQLRQQADAWKRDELLRLYNKLEKSNLDDAARKDIERAFDRLVNKLLHLPMESLREAADQPNQAGLLDALRKLFKLR